MALVRGQWLVASYYFKKTSLHLYPVSHSCSSSCFVFTQSVLVWACFALGSIARHPVFIDRFQLSYPKLLQGTNEGRTEKKKEVKEAISRLDLNSWHPDHEAQALPLSCYNRCFCYSRRRWEQTKGHESNWVFSYLVHILDTWCAKCEGVSSYEA